MTLNNNKQIKQKEEKSPAAIWLDGKHKTGCNHQWSYEGHGHNDSHYKCIKCKIEDDY